MSQLADDFQDTKNSYGWLSIVLHWLTATWVICLWFLGNSSQSQDLGSYSTWSQWHVSIGVSGIVLILIRIWWRIRSGHPRIEGQADFVHLSAKIAHYILIAAIALMIISGPMILWSNGAPIILYGKLIIHSPFSSALDIANEIRALHFWTSTAIIVISTVHIVGAFKHMMFNHDETFIRILMPRKPDKGPD